jgi:murein DD-endopeptidase MepM/ murein hydrolase activator NlpD
VTIPRLVYRSGGAIVTGLDAKVSEHGCTVSGPSGARATIASLSLFRGAVTASRVTLTRGNLIATTVTGLAVGGTQSSPRSGARIAVPGVGYLRVGRDTHIPVSRDVIAVGALALHLTSTHDGLPPGTVVLVATIGLPIVARSSLPARSTPRLHAATRHAKRKKTNPAASGEPLRVTPPLALRHYVFPVAGTSEYIDTYGAFRSDVPGNWHHGDDIFASLGTPVVAVANGTINRVGWEKLGGWRLWVRDDAGDEFYYAHLSGYAPTDLHSDRVRVGEVIGFIGNTGDAFTTAPHLHFEVHPRQLLRLGYNGAVDPTTYLNGWTHLSHVVVPRPVTPPLPTQPQLRSEARYVFRELLAARHLVSHGPSPKQRPHVSIPAGANGLAPTPREIAHESAPPLASTERGSSTSRVVLIAGLGGALGICVAGALFGVRRRRDRRPPTPVD